MKRASIASIVILMLVYLSPVFPAETGNDEVMQPGMINFDSAHPLQVLDIYAVMAGRKLVISSHVRSVATGIKFKPQIALKRSEAVKLIEKALLEQAGIVITTLDDKRASVTYNDALPVSTTTDGKSIQK